MSEKTKIASLSISAEITLNMHSLNNEGGEGNQIITRQVTVVDDKKEPHTVNAISGDMFKHIHAGHQANYCVENALKLSEKAKLLSPDRISADELNKVVKEKSQAGVQDGIISTCTITDTHGVLMVDDVKGIKNTPRKSLVEFGWTIGKPTVSDTETHFHMRGATQDSPNPTPFNRPTNHGVYAFICSLDLYKIGFNEFKREYPIEESERLERYKSVMMGLLNSVLNPKGAMTSTQKPHITNFAGVITISESMTPAPTVSPLNDTYDTQILKITENLNKIDKKAKLQCLSFNSMDEFTEKMADLINEYEPYRIS
ncbi:DevR family CRISPR-associated autoregulator [Flammeovirga sp. EKP202]|uniref:DevR family CRISPR-associated autoregulator n=1 Tax=Flammeovirga sp. EKP202 TaxID=2770592 RepID=UPI00165FD84C|nr:DevR family CRISPR-associated autoregulator [Flammeovirga sp. EKP202]MBD0402740.1 DevR family CRISPR-associated autoregulator [Flammeovirga sp. EKP202]